jgi:endoribonuclease Nob1
MVTNLHYTTQEILEELGEDQRLRLELTKEWLQIREPSARSLKPVQEAAAETGDTFVLSTADLSILALALEIRGEGARVTLLTDDYAIQNVAARLQIPFQNFAWRGIRRTITWELYCPTCRKTYNTRQRICPNCGSTLKRRMMGAKNREAHVKS